MTDLEDYAGEAIEEAAALEAMVQARFPNEVKMWQAIRHTLKEGQQSFVDFNMWLGECPPGHELRPKRDGKRAPFEISHFEWLPKGTPRRVDSALRRTDSVQGQLDELRTRIEVLEVQTKVGGPR